jgi:hypothetical protein
MSLTLKEAIPHYIPHIPGWSTPEKCQVMVDCILETKPDISLEIGIYGGRGLISMGMAHREIRKGIAVGLDPYNAEACIEGTNDKTNDEWWSKLNLTEIQHHFISNVCAHYLLDWVHWHRLTSRQARVLFDENEIGFMHQDGNHSAEVSSWEVDNYASIMADGSYWIMDDTNWDTTKLAQKMMLSYDFREMQDFGTWKLYRKI